MTYLVGVLHFTGYFFLFSKAGLAQERIKSHLTEGDEEHWESPEQIL